MRCMIAADHLYCPINEPLDDRLPIARGPQRWVHFQIGIVIGPRRMRSTESFLVTENLSAVLLPERLTARNSCVRQREMVRASFAGNRKATFARRAKQFDTSSAAQVLAMDMRAGQFSKHDIARDNHVLPSRRPAAQTKNRAPVPFVHHAI